MFEENENLVDESTENTVEQTAEEIVEETTDEVEETEQVETMEEVEGEEEAPKEQGKFYTDDELNKTVDDLVSKKLGRKISKIEKEYKRKYSKLENVLNAGLGTSDVEDATNQLTDFYKEQGINIPNMEPQYSEREMELLAKAEADDIISSGYQDIKEEVDRLSEIGIDNMSKRDKLLFHRLASERTRIEEEKELASIGVNKEMLNDEAFRVYREKLNPKMSLKEQYEMYLESKPKKENKKMGSMKSGPTSEIKEHYTEDEISKLTSEQLDDPKVWDAVIKSMTSSK